MTIEVFESMTIEIIEECSQHLQQIDTHMSHVTDSIATRHS